MPLEFRKRAAEQSQSFFAALPDELKLIILRYLLVAPRRITPLQEEYPRTYQAASATCGYHLYPQILSTCQYIHKLGNPILYDENRLEVWLRDGSWSASSGVFCLSEFCIFESQSRPKCDFGKMASILKSIRRFKKLQLTVLPLASHMTSLDAICTFLTGAGVAWQEKDLIVFIKGFEQHLQYDYSDATDFEALVRGVCFLRCKQTRFEGFPRKSRAFSISQMTVDESMPDLFRMHSNLEREILTERDVSKRDRLLIYLSSLWMAVRNWDIEAFRQSEDLIKALLSKAAVARYLRSNVIQEGRKFYNLRSITNDTHRTSISYGLIVCCILDWDAKAMCTASDFDEVPCAFESVLGSYATQDGCATQ